MLESMPVVRIRVTINDFCRSVSQSFLQLKFEDRKLCLPSMLTLDSDNVNSAQGVNNTRLDDLHSIIQYQWMHRTTAEFKENDGP